MSEVGSEEDARCTRMQISIHHMNILSFKPKQTLNLSNKVVFVTCFVENKVFLMLNARLFCDLPMMKKMCNISSFPVHEYDFDYKRFTWTA